MRGDLSSDLEPSDAHDLLATGDTLRRERPVPAAAYRGDLRRRLLVDRRLAGRPQRLWLAIAGSMAAGSGFLAIAAIGLAGSGPFAA